MEKPFSGVRSWPSSKPASSSSTQHSSPKLSLDGYGGTEATAENLKKALEKELSLDSSDLRSYGWYHGTILRKRAEELVVHDGDFIVRDCISQPGDYVITCKWQNMPLHMIIKKVILQPNTVYERTQFCFEKELFDSIPDFITYYAGSKCPLSESIGAVISNPINRCMPLSYYASRYGSQCIVHYAAKAFESCGSRDEIKLENNENESKKLEEHVLCENVKVNNAVNITGNNTEVPDTRTKKLNPQWPPLIRVGSDPILSPNTSRRKVEHRPNSGSFSSDVIKDMSLKSDEKPPPKPSRVPSKKYVQKPIVRKQVRKPSIDEAEENIPPNAIPIKHTSGHNQFQRQLSETRFSFLDRPSISDDDASTPTVEDMLFTLPEIEPLSVFNPQNFTTPLLNSENAPLEGPGLNKVRQMLFSTPSKILACHLTKMDLQITKCVEDFDLGLGVTSGLELLLLPQGGQLQKDLLERTESMKLFVAITILVSPNEEERVELLSKWIKVATETKTTFGNLYGFSSIMLGLTIQEIAELQSTWFALRQNHTEIAFAFETKLRPTFKVLQNASGLEAPNTCLPYILSLILILQSHSNIMGIIEEEPFNNEKASDHILNFYLPGSYSTNDFGLQLLFDHLEIGRNILQQFYVYKTNGETSLCGFKLDNILLDLFNTEFHLRMLWGFRGSVVASKERHEKFQKVLYLLFNKCNTITN